MTSYNASDVTADQSLIDAPPDRSNGINKTSPAASIVPNFDYYLWVYVSLPLFLLGVTGNIITLLVMRRKMFVETSTGAYMSCMALMDTSFLTVGLLLDWLEWMGIVTVKYLGIWVCRVYRFLFYGTGDAAIWIIVAFSFDRFVAVCFPLHKSTVCVRSRAYLSAAVILVASTVKNAHVFWTRGPELHPVTGAPTSNLCTAIEPYAWFEKFVRPWLAFALAMALPFCAILLFNALMINSLVRAQRRRSSAALGACRASSGSLGATGGAAGNRAYMQTTLMCLSVSFTFLVCIAPSIVLLIGKPSWATHGWYDYAKVISNLMVYVNHSVNFLLYCLTGQRFRSELSLMFERCCGGGKGSKGGGGANSRATGTTSLDVTAAANAARRLSRAAAAASVVAQAGSCGKAVAPASGTKSRSMIEMDQAALVGFRRLDSAEGVTGRDAGGEEDDCESANGNLASDANGGGRKSGDGERSSAGNESSRDSQ